MAKQKNYEVTKQSLLDSIASINPNTNSGRRILARLEFILTLSNAYPDQDIKCVSSQNEKALAFAAMAPFVDGVFLHLAKQVEKEMRSGSAEKACQASELLTKFNTDIGELLKTLTDCIGEQAEKGNMAPDRLRKWQRSRKD